MVEEQTSAQTIRMKHQRKLSPPINDNSSHHRSVAVSHIKKMPSLDRHRSHQIQHVRLNGIIQVSNSSSSRDSMNITANNLNQNIAKLPKNQIQPLNFIKMDRSHQPMKHSTRPSNNTIKDNCVTQDLPIKHDQVNVEHEYRSEKFNDGNKDSFETKYPDQHFNTATSNAHNAVDQRKYQTSDRRNRTDKRQKKGGYCSPCPLLCVLLGLIVGVLLLAAIAAILVVLITPKTSTSSETTSTSTTSTTGTTTTTSVTTTSSATSTTTSPRPLVQITQAGDFIIGLYNTIAGGPTGGYGGRYSNASELPQMAIDGSLSTKYVNYGNNGSVSIMMYQPGRNTGFYVTPSVSNASVACGLQFATGNDFPMRDPLNITLEGTNATLLNSSSSWTLIYSGPTGIDPVIVPTRQTYGTLQLFSNTVAYESYRLLITLQRGIEDCVQYAEFKIMGYY